MDLPTAVFRADASALIGGGHVVRSLALADALARRNWRCLFVSIAGTAETVPKLCGARRQTHEIAKTAAEDPNALIQILPAGCDLVVLDGYDFADSYERHCRGWANQILVIDDLANRPHDCDILVDQTIGQVQDVYAALVPKSCERLVGASYGILRDEFQRARPAALQRRRRGGSVERILISMGMTDPDNATAYVLDAIASSGLGAVIDVVLGPDAPHASDVARTAAALGDQVEIHTGVDDMARLMAHADIAIGGAGTSALERCCLGLPSIVLTLAANQEVQADGLNMAGAALTLGSVNRLSTGETAEALTQLGADQQLRMKMGQAAASLCDGRGNERICEAIVGAGNAHWTSRARNTTA